MPQNLKRRTAVAFPTRRAPRRINGLRCAPRSHAWSSREIERTNMLQGSSRYVIIPPAPGIAVSTGLVTEDHNLSVLAINTHTLAVGEPPRGPGHTRNRREPVFTSDNRSV